MRSVDWPANPFWDYALELYGRGEVPVACLELQRRHGLDVNMVLWCLWLAGRGIELRPAMVARAGRALDDWRIEVVRPLRAVRNRLKVRLADPPPGSIAERWPTLARHVRERTLALELDAERLAQLCLAEIAADLVAGRASGPALASANLGRYWSFGGQDRAALGTLLSAAFPDVPPDDVTALVATLAPED